MLKFFARFMSHRLLLLYLSFALALFTVLTFCGALQVKASQGDRLLKLTNLSTGEKLDIVFRRGDIYLPDALDELDHFLRDWRTNERHDIDPRVLDLLWEIYDETGSTARIEIMSGYRSAKTNRMLARQGRKVATESQHIHGRAIDFRIRGVSTERLQALALRKQYGGVGYYPGSKGDFVHIDVGSVRHWPRLSSKKLKKVFGSAASLHIPSNGRPLAGHAAMKKKFGLKGLKPDLSDLRMAGTFTGQERAAINDAHQHLFERKDRQALVADLKMPRSRPEPQQLYDRLTLAQAETGARPDFSLTRLDSESESPVPGRLHASPGTFQTSMSSLSSTLAALEEGIRQNELSRRFRLQIPSDQIVSGNPVTVAVQTSPPVALPADRLSLARLSFDRFSKGDPSPANDNRLGAYLLNMYRSKVMTGRVKSRPKPSFIPDVLIANSSP